MCSTICPYILRIRRKPALPNSHDILKKPQKICPFLKTNNAGERAQSTRLPFSSLHVRWPSGGWSMEDAGIGRGHWGGGA